MQYSYRQLYETSGMTETEHHCYSNCPNYIRHTNKPPFSNSCQNESNRKKQPNSKTIGKFTCSLIRFAFKKPGIKLGGTVLDPTDNFSFYSNVKHLSIDVIFYTLETLGSAF